MKSTKLLEQIDMIFIKINHLYKITNFLFSICAFRDIRHNEFMTKLVKTEIYIFDCKGNLLLGKL